jgi:hypothetical protein
MATISGGDKLAARLKELSAGLKKGASVQIGFLEGATYPDGTSVPMVAAIQEFGAPAAGIPPRPFFRTMIAAKSDGWGDAAAQSLKATDFDAAKTLALVGEGIKGQLQQSIAELTSPPLSPVTLMLRKMRADNPSLVVTGSTVGEAARRVAAGQSSAGVSTKPLVDSGDMLNAVDYAVKSK